MTTAPPLSASLKIIDWSFARDLIAFLSAKDMLYLLFELGLFCTFSIYLSNAALRFLGGIKSLLFLTREIFGSSVPLKYSARRNFLVNSNISSFNSCWFPRSGDGVNFKPFSNSFCSESVNLFLDKFIIFVVVSLFVVSAVKFLALFDRPALKMVLVLV